MNKAPATLCSCGRATRATKSEPAEKVKSAPKTEMIAAGKPNAQYGDEGMITAKRTAPAAVNIVPPPVEQIVAT